MANSDSERSTPTVKPPTLDGNAPPPTAPGARKARRRATPAASRVEAQLRARVEELETRVTEITRCLEVAEHAADEARSAARHAEQTIETIRGTTSWRLTAPMRSAMARVRRILGR
jgi:phage shock protein A